MTSYLNKLFWTSFRSKPGGIMVYRGYGAASRASGKSNSKPSSRRSSTTSRRASMSSIRSTGTAADREKSKLATGDGAIPTFDSGDESSEHAEPEKTIKPWKTHKSTLSADDKHLVPPPLAHKAKKAVHLAENAKDRIKEQLDKGNAAKATKSRQEAMDEEHVPVTNEEEDDSECTDLILVIHGIGQQLATSYEGFNFVYAANLLRQVMR